MVGDAKCEWVVMASWMPPIGLLLSHLSRLSDGGVQCWQNLLQVKLPASEIFKVVPADSLPISSARQN